MRTCDKCGRMIDEGFVVGDGEAYYCSTKCMLKDMTLDEYNWLYETDGAYWTQWEDEGEYYEF